MDLERQPFRYAPLRLVPLGRHAALHDADGRPLEGGIDVPRVGPLVISNNPRVFPGSGGVLRYETKARDELAMRLEYIMDRCGTSGSCLNGTAPHCCGCWCWCCRGLVGAAVSSALLV